MSKKQKKREEAFWWKPTESEVEAYLAALVTELNLRLLLELETERGLISCGGQELCVTAGYGRMFWVESITLDSYQEAKEKPIRWWERIWNFLIRKQK